MCKTFNKLDQNLAYACAIVERIARDTLSKRGKVMSKMGVEGFAHVMEYADIFHCLPIEQARDEIMELYGIEFDGSFDNVSECLYHVPSYWDIGKVYARLIQDTCDGRPYAEVALEVCNSWIADRISDFNFIMWFSFRDYVEWAYRLGEEEYLRSIYGV